jgi:uncharacterized protein
MPWTHGHFHWNELQTRDVEQAKRFYALTIGWTYEAVQSPDGTYWIGKHGDTMVAGLMQLEDPAFAGLPEAWVPYLAVDDVDARVERATAAGAVLLRPIFDVPGVGRIAMLREPGGAMLGWMTPAAP